MKVLVACEYTGIGNQTDSGQNRLAPSATRGQDRSRTYFGIASAMAFQWGCQDLNKNIS